MECRICPRNCGIDRENGKKGFCKESDRIRVARAALHMWEEPCISGENGSGTIFFSGCTLRCVYCQNHEISNAGAGLEISVQRLAEICMELQEKGAHNINLVTPTQFTLQVIEGLKLARKMGLRIPIVYNTSGYEEVDTLRLLEGMVDIYLPDFKYISSEPAKKYSLAVDYPQKVKAAIDEMVRQTGTPQFTEDGMLQRGVIVRHLLLPGQLTESKKIVKYLYQTYGDQIYMSLMNQYTPVAALDREKYPELDHKVTKRAYDKLIDYALEIGVEQAFIQEGETAEESFIPAFSYEGVERF